MSENGVEVSDSSLKHIPKLGSKDATYSNWAMLALLYLKSREWAKYVTHEKKCNYKPTLIKRDVEAELQQLQDVTYAGPLNDQQRTQRIRTLEKDLREAKAQRKCYKKHKK